MSAAHTFVARNAAGRDDIEAVSGNQTQDVDEGAGAGLAGSVPVWTVILLLAGLGIMVWAAANIMNLSRWAEQYGQITVFLLFFLVMAVGGRWFWSGVDALIAAIRGRGKS